MTRRRTFRRFFPTAELFGDGERAAASRLARRYGSLAVREVNPGTGAWVWVVYPDVATLAASLATETIPGDAWERGAGMLLARGRRMVTIPEVIDAAGAVAEGGA
jgi:hypothetical protein